jgi:TnpA family transposase
MAEACNTGPEPFIRYDNPALRRDRLSWVKQNYLRDDTLAEANARLVEAQNKTALARARGGGEAASADGMRFVAPVRTAHAGPNPEYFGPLKGVAWYNLLSDQFTGLNAIPVPGTLRDSLVLLAVVLEQQTELRPTQIMTDTGAIAMSCSGCSGCLATGSAPGWPTSAARASGVPTPLPITESWTRFPSTG